MVGCCQKLRDEIDVENLDYEAYGKGGWIQVFGFGANRFFGDSPGKYMAFKVLEALCVTGIFAWSITEDAIMYECKAGNPNSSFAQWFIYMTHWTLSLQLIYVWLSTFTMYKAQRALTSEAMPFHCKATWVLYDILIPQTFMVFVQFFALVYDPEKSRPLSFFTHGANFVIMISDVIASRQPYYLLHFFSYFISICLYLAWTFVFFYSGGLDCEGNPWIYEAFNYSKDETFDQAKQTILMLTFVVSPIVVVGFFLTIRCCFPYRGPEAGDEKEPLASD